MVGDRAHYLGMWRHYKKNVKRMITIEPILDFDLWDMMILIKKAEPDWVNIGADSHVNNLPEPSWGKVEELAGELREFTKVRMKKNLNRLKRN